MTNYLDATILTIICSVMILLIIALIIMFVLFRKHLSRYINALNSSEETLNVEILNRNFFYDTLPIAMASCDKDGRMTFINKAMIKMWDILPTDIVMQGKFNLKDSQVLTDNEKIRILSGEDIEITITANLKPGETVKLMGKQITQKIMLICRFSTSYDVHKNISQYNIVMINMLNSYEKEQEIIRMNSMLSLGLRNTGYKFYSYHVKEDRYYKVSSEGYTRSYMTEEATFEQVHPLDRAEYREMFLNVKCGNIPSNKMKLRATNPITKEYDHIECVTIGIVDKKSNEVETIVQTIKNINTEHSVIVDLKSAREQLDLIHKTMKMTIWYYDYETKLFATASQETKPNYIDGVLAVLHPDDVHKFIDFWSPLFNGVKDKQYGVFRRKTKTDNEYRFYEYMGIHYIDENSHKDCIIGYYHDVDEYYKYLGEIENYEHCLNLSQNQIRVAMYNSKDETVRYLGIDSESENSADVMYFMNLMTEESRATAMTIYKAAQQGILGEKTEILHFDSQNAPFHGNLSIAVTVRPFSTTKKNYDKYLLIIRNITDLTDYIQQ